MPVISALLTVAGGRPSAAELETSLLAGQTLLADGGESVV
jgi:hypothetical protein